MNKFKKSVGKYTRAHFYILMVLALIVGVLLPMVSTPAVVLAIDAPTVSTGDPTLVTNNSLSLNYTINATGGENPQVYVVWKQLGHYSTSQDKPANLPELLEYWEHYEDEGVKAAGTYALPLSDLGPSQVYWRVIAVNSGGITYGTPVESYLAEIVPKSSFTSASNDVAKARGPNTYFAQTFNTTSAYDAVGVALYTHTGGDVTVTLKAVNASRMPEGAALGTATIPTTYVSQDWTWIYFETPVSLTNATEYAIVVETSYAGASWHYFKLRKTSSLYAEGEMWKTENDGVSWSLYSAYLGADCDLLFKVIDAGGQRVSTLSTGYPLGTDFTETTVNLRGEVGGIGAFSTNITFEYGLTDAYGSETTNNTTYYAAQHVGDYTPISQAVAGLTAGTEYHCRIKAVNVIGTVYGSDVQFYTPDSSEEGLIIVEDVNPFSASIANQRKSFYAQGRYWVFFTDPVTSLVSYMSSSGGLTWSSSSVAIGEFVVEGENDSQICVYFDGTSVHIVTGRRAYALAYKMGVPNSDGTITWNAAGTQEVIGEALEDKLYTAPYITTDSDGYPWVIVGTCDVSSLNVQIFRSSTKNGTWTETADYPKELAWGSFWQRGLALSLNNGDMYFIAGRRGSAIFTYGGAEPLKGVRYWAANNTFSTPASITTSSMDYIGDVAADPFALFSAVSWGGEAFLTFTNTDNALKFLKYSPTTNSWSAEETLASDLSRRTAPALTVHDADGKLYCFWLDGDDNRVYVKIRGTNGVWSSSPTALKFESLLGNVANINTWEHSIEGKTAVIYRTSRTSELGYLHGVPATGGDFDLRFFTMSTGFAVGTDTPASVTPTSATLQGHLVHDGNETCSVRFQWGVDTSYGSETTWQSGMETGDTFSQAITGLTADTTYHFRAQARHADLVTVSGADLSFIASSLTPPTIVTGSATSVAQTTATLQGTLTSLGGYSPVYVSFQYGTTTAYGSTTAEQTKTSTGTYSTGISGLVAETTYHFRARVRYGALYIYGADTTFITPAATAPSISTVSATSVTQTGATLGGSLSSLGIETHAYVYFQYGTTVGYGTSTAEQNKTVTGTYSAAISGLSSDTTYHYRAVARYNTTLYLYGADSTFSTGATGLGAPVAFSAESNATQITLGWIKGTGASNTLVRFSTDTYPATRTSGEQIYFGTGTSYVHTGLTPGIPYYYSAWSEAGGTYSTNFATVAGQLSAPPGEGEFPAPNTLLIEDVKVFTNYLESNDVLVVVSYKILYDVTPVEDIRDYFKLQILDGSTLKSQGVPTQWGYRPGSFYLAYPNSISWGGVYTVELSGRDDQFAAPAPSVEFSMTAGCWVGGDLTVLDDWVLQAADRIGTYYGVALVEYIPGLGRVLTVEGGEIFEKAIPGLREKRPHLFSSYVEGIDVDDDERNATYSDSLSGTFGDTIMAQLDDLGSFVGISGQTVGMVVWIVAFFLIVGGIVALSGSAMVGGIVGLPFLFAGVYLDLISLSILIILGIVLTAYLLWKLIAQGV